MLVGESLDIALLGCPTKKKCSQKCAWLVGAPIQICNVWGISTGNRYFHSLQT